MSWEAAFSGGHSMSRGSSMHRGTLRVHYLGEAACPWKQNAQEETACPGGAACPGKQHAQGEHHKRDILYIAYLRFYVDVL
jgi:hypothetical protein